MTDYIVVLITVPDEKEVAETLATKIVENRLGACVNIISSINSIFFWNGQIENEKEKLLVVKTKIDLFDKLKSFVKENHPYQVPEIIGLPIIVGNDEYLNWLEETVHSH